MPLDKGNSSNTSAFGNIAEEIPEFQLDEEIGSAGNMQTQHSLCDENHKVDEPITKKPKTEFAGLITAIRIAKWFARANGFTAHNKSLYVSQDTVISNNFIKDINNFVQLISAPSDSNSLNNVK